MTDRMVRTLIVKPDGTWETKEVRDQLEDLQRLVEGYIEYVYLRTVRAHAYCNEEGKLQGLHYNHLATQLAHFLGWDLGQRDILNGTVIFLGTGEVGHEANVPQTIVDMCQTLAEHGV